MSEEAAGRLRDAVVAVSSEATAGAPEEVIAAAVKEQRINLLVIPLKAGRAYFSLQPVAVTCTPCLKQLAPKR